MSTLSEQNFGIIFAICQGGDFERDHLTVHERVQSERLGPKCAGTYFAGSKWFADCAYLNCEHPVSSSNLQVGFWRNGNFRSGACRCVGSRAGKPSRGLRGLFATGKRVYRLLVVPSVKFGFSHASFNRRGPAGVRTLLEYSLFIAGDRHSTWIASRNFDDGFFFTFYHLDIISIEMNWIISTKIIFQWARICDG